MAYSTSNMGISVWDLETDPYNHDELRQNWELVDKHDHSDGKGAPLDISSIPALDSSRLLPGSVGTSQLQDGAVTGVKIANNTIVTTNIGDRQVTGIKIALATVQLENMAVNSVGTSKIVDGAVLSAKIGDGQVTQGKIHNAAVTSEKIAEKNVRNDEIADNAITNRTIANGAVDTSQLSNLSVTNAKIHPDSVGIDELQLVPAVHVILTGTKSVTGSWASIIWDQARYQNPYILWHDTNNQTKDHITIPKAGLYLLTGGAFCQDSGNGGTKEWRLRRNNVILQSDGPDSQGNVHLGKSIVVACGKDDVIDAQVTKNGSGSVTLQREHTHLSATWIAPNPS